jgi:DNA-binding PadR family transcriptional regulator
MNAKRICPCEGHTLDRLLQPAVMALLAEAPAHGYAICERLADSPMMRGAKPDRTGLYRLLDAMKQQGVVARRKQPSGLGPAKYVFELTAAGRQCLAKWIATLDEYQQAIAELVETMRAAAAR